jgi:type II secretory pathway pseudopilin PulG
MLEMMLVVTIIGIIAAAARPALRLLSDARRVGAVQEVERALLFARATAMATGNATGVELTPSGLRILTIPAASAAPESVLGPDGQPRGIPVLAEDQRDFWITHLQDGTGTSVPQATLWFSIDGTPELRDTNGTRIGPWTDDARIEIADTGVINIRRVTGALARE